MKIVIEISGYDKEWITNSYHIPEEINMRISEAIINGTPFPNITDEQISDAFQVAIANYWKEKSKYLTSPPTPCCSCPIQERSICEEHQTQSLISRYQNDFINKVESEKVLEIEPQAETYGYCVYHGIDCDYAGRCIECPHNTEEDIEWFKQDEERAESEDK